MATLTEMVKGRVRFLFYRAGELWYRTDVDGFEFPVPIADTGDAVFGVEDKGMFFMRWIRKHLVKLDEFRALGNEPLAEGSSKVIVEM